MFKENIVHFENGPYLSVWLVRRLIIDGMRLRPFVARMARGRSRRGSTPKTKMLVPIAFEVSKKMA